jgi:hypothetical protein
MVILSLSSWLKMEGQAATIMEKCANKSMITEIRKERNVSETVENEIEILTLRVEKRLVDFTILEEKRMKEEDEKAEKLKQEKQQREHEGVSGLRKSSLESFVIFCNSEVLDLQQLCFKNKMELNKILIGVHVDARKNQREHRRHSSI